MERVSNHRGSREQVYYVLPGVPVLGLLEEDMEMSSRSSWDQSATDLWSEISGIREKGDPCVGSVGFGRSGD